MSACCRCMPTPIPRRPQPGCTDRASRGRHARVIHRAVGGGPRRPRPVLRVRLDRGDRHVIRLLNLSERERPVVFIGPYEHHSNELVWRESVADVVTIGEVGRRPDRRRPPRARVATPRRPSAEDRQLLGRLERHRNHHRRRPGVAMHCTPRRAVVLGLCDRRPVPADRHVGKGRRVPVAAQVRRRTRDARCARRQARAAAQPRTVACRAVARSCSSPRTVTPTTPIRCSARRAGRRRSSSRSAPGSCSRSRSGSAAAEIRRREHDFARRALASWGANPNIEILGNTATERLPIVSLRPAPSAAACCTRTSSSPCSATCSGSRRAAAASVPARTYTACTESTTNGRRG